MDLDYEKLMKYRNTHSPFARQLGIQLTELVPGRAVAEKTVTEEDLNPLAYVHGGVYFSLADTACGSAMVTHGYKAVTLNASYQFLRPARAGDRLRAEAVEVKSGRTVCVFDVRITGQAGSLLGTGTFTFYRLDEKVTL